VKKLSLLFFIAAIGISSFAQDPGTRKDRQSEKQARKQKINSRIKQDEEGVLVFRKQSIFGLQAKTNGYGAFYELGFMKTTRKSNIFRIDIVETKLAKEEKQLGGSFVFGNAYIFGKINYFYPITLGFGQQYILGQKGNKNGVAVSAIYNAGLSIGLLRPYYINVDDPVTGEAMTVKFNGTSQDSALFLCDGCVSGGAGFGKGWGEMKIKPGAFAKAAMRFDYGRFNEVVSGLEIGMSVEYYGSKIPIMLLQKDRRLFFQGYIALLFGKRK
jgi:hypothetical protein